MRKAQSWKRFSFWMTLKPYLKSYVEISGLVHFSRHMMNVNKINFLSSPYNTLLLKKNENIFNFENKNQKKIH